MRWPAVTLALCALTASAASAQTTPATKPTQAAAASQASLASQSQIEGAVSSPAAAPPQLTAETPQTAAPLAPTRDRCQTPANAALARECARIAAEATAPLDAAPRANGPAIANPDSGSSSLVNSIVSGGTGTVVQLPSNSASVDEPQ